MNEEWRPIPGYEGLYDISNFGNIKSSPKVIKLWHGGTFIRHKEFIKPNFNSGYMKARLYKDTQQKTYQLHRLVMKAFVGECDLEVNHIDGNPKNNHLTNLEYCTHSENISHAYKIGLIKPKFGTVTYSKKVQCLCTGRIMIVKDAAKWLGINYGYLIMLLKNRFPNWTNFIYYETP